MDSSKHLQENEECSSSESGWTTYIASPDNETDHSEYEDVMTVERGRGYKKDDVEEDVVDSDDSMASDASSGPKDQRHLYRDERKYVVGKKHIHNQQEEKKKQQNQQKKAEKDKPGQSAGRSKKM